MLNLPLQVFVFDIVTGFLIILLFVQFYYIHRLHTRLGEQSKSIAQLKEMVMALYDASKAESDTTVRHHSI